jgi:hypothetical protein
MNPSHLHLVGFYSVLSSDNTEHFEHCSFIDRMHESKQPTFIGWLWSEAVKTSEEW